MTWALSKTKPAYLGKRSVDMQIAKGVGRVLAGFTLLDDALPAPKESQLVIRDSAIAGRVSLAVPSLGKVIGLAYVPTDCPRPARASRSASSQPHGRCRSGARERPSTIPRTSGRNCDGRAKNPLPHELGKVSFPRNDRLGVGRCRCPVQVVCERAAPHPTSLCEATTSRRRLVTPAPSRRCLSLPLITRRPISSAARRFTTCWLPKLRPGGGLSPTLRSPSSMDRCRLSPSPTCRRCHRLSFKGRGTVPAMHAPHPCRGGSQPCLPPARAWRAFLVLAASEVGTAQPS